MPPSSIWLGRCTQVVVVAGRDQVTEEKGSSLLGDSEAGP